MISRARHVTVLFGGGWLEQTLTIQPDSSAGVDTLLDKSSPTLNFGTNVQINSGERTGFADAIQRSLIKFDLSSIPSNAVIISATLTLYLAQDGNFRASNNRTLRVYRS